MINILDKIVFSNDWRGIGARRSCLSFQTVERARQWYSSEEYRPALEVRQRAADNEILIVEGTTPPIPS